MRATTKLSVLENSPSSDSDLKGSSIFRKENIPIIGIAVGIIAFSFQLSVLYPWHIELHDSFSTLEVCVEMLPFRCWLRRFLCWKIFYHFYIADASRKQFSRGIQNGNWTKWFNKGECWTTNEVKISSTNIRYPYVQINFARVVLVNHLNAYQLHGHYRAFLELFLRLYSKNDMHSYSAIDVKI